MKQFVNTDRIIEGYILEPFVNDGESPFSGNSHGWQVVLVVGYSQDGYQNKIIINEESERKCIDKLHFLGLICVE